MKSLLNRDLAVYLNDHLAGSVAALALIEDFKANAENPNLVPVFAKLHEQVKADQAILQDLLRAVGGEPDGIKSTSAWVAEKLSRLKLRLASSEKGSLSLFEGLEILELGIEGKRLMWVLLQGIWSLRHHGEAPNFKHLIEMARQQREKVEELRVTMGRQLFRHVTPVE